MADEDTSHEQDIGSGVNKKIYDLSMFPDVVDLVKNNDDNIIKSEVSSHIKKLAGKLSLDSYHLLFLFDELDSIGEYHANRLYEAAAANEKNKNILLLLVSRGGGIEPAYLISKTLRQLSKEKFVTVVPRKAKSAATLIALGANEIHMGLMSELGPVDPQIAGYPAMGLANSLEVLAELACKFPESSNLFSNYLVKSLKLNELGYFGRVNESAAQYAERLLANKTFPDGNTPAKLANHFVNHYKDHGFVIDMDEAMRLLGNSVVIQDSLEYEFGNLLYKFIDLFSIICRIIKDQNIKYVGTVDSGLELKQLPKTE
jgi:hypothetical protein